MDQLSQDGYLLPDILFLDLRMPGKTHCMTDEKKRINQLQKMAIAIYSASSSAQDIEQTIVRGANVYIKKYVVT